MPRLKRIDINGFILGQKKSLTNKGLRDKMATKMRLQSLHKIYRRKTNLAEKINLTASKNNLLNFSREVEFFYF